MRAEHHAISSVYSAAGGADLPPAEIFEACMKGDAIFTITSLSTGRSYTYEVIRFEARQGPMLAVNLVEDGHVIFGEIDPRQISLRAGGFRLSRVCQLEHGEKAIEVFSWLWRHLAQGRLPRGIKIKMEGEV